MTPSSRLIRRQSGATLIEILVSILVISLGILAMVIMQLNTTRFAKASEYQAIGALLAGDLADRIRANRPQSGDAKPNYAYLVKYTPLDQAPTAGTDCNTAAAKCTAQQIAEKDKLDWRIAVYNALPQGDAYITTDTTGVDLWLIWLEPDSTGADNKTMSPDGNNTCPANIVNAGTKVPSCMHFRTDL